MGFLARVAPYWVNGLHPEMVTLCSKLLDAEVAQMNAREREIKEAEAMGRAVEEFTRRAQQAGLYAF